MEDEVDLITDMTFGSQCSTPKCKTPEARCQLTPNTAYKIIDRLSETVDECLEFRQVEHDINLAERAETEVNDVDSLKRALKDSDTLICDYRNEISALKTENGGLRDDLTKGEACLAQQHKDYELKMFRLQKEVDNKNLEVFNLKKDKNDFDHSLKLLESRHARKISELTEALNQARRTDLELKTVWEEPNLEEFQVLKSEIEDAKATIAHLQELLQLQTNRGDLLSEAFAETIQGWEEEAKDAVEMFEHCNKYDDVTFDDFELTEIDLNIQVPQLSFDPFNIDDVLKSLDDNQVTEMIYPVREGICGMAVWCRSLLDSWSCDVNENFQETVQIITEREKLAEALEITKQALSKAEADYANLLADNGKLQTASESFFSIEQTRENFEELTQIKNEADMTTYMSAAEDFVEAVLTPPVAETAQLDNFAKEFAEYLIANEVFHPDDVPPTDSGVFAFLLDRYLLLVETYHKARSEFEEKLTELEEQSTVAAQKAQALISQISEFDMSDSTLCDTSVTASSVEFDRDFRTSTMCDSFADASICATMIADATRDPLELNTATPEQRMSRTILQTPQSRIPRGNFQTPGSAKTRCSFAPSTPRIEEEPSVSFNLPGIFRTPVQRLLSRETCSTAKKSVTFKSPLFDENARLKATINEKLEAILQLERVVQVGVEGIAHLEDRIAQLEATAAARSEKLERAESAFYAQREKLETDLSRVSEQLSQLTNQLIVEAINLDPGLEKRLRNEAPIDVLAVLLETTVARFKNAQDDEKQAFEKERQEWFVCNRETALITQTMQMKIDELTNHILEITKDAEKYQLEHAGLEDQITDLEEIERLKRESAQLASHEFESLKLALEASESEKKLLKLENDEKNAKLAELTSNLQAVDEQVEEIRRSVVGHEVSAPLTILEKIRLLNKLVDERVTALNNEIEVLTKASHDLETELTTLKVTVPKMEDKISALEEELQSLGDLKTRELSELERQAQNLIVELEITKTDVTDKQQVIEKLRVDFASQEKAIGLFEEKLNQLESEKDRGILDEKMLREKAVTECDALKTEIDVKNNEITAIKDEFTTIIDQLNATINEKVKVLEVTDLKVAELSEVVAGDWKTTTNHLQDKLNQTLREKSNDSDRLAAVELELADTFARNQELQAELNGLRRELEQSAEALTVSTEELAATKIQLASEKSAILEKLSETMLAYNATKNDLDQVQRKLVDLAAENVELMAEKQELATSFDKFNAEIDGLSMELGEKMEQLVERITAESALRDKLSAKELAFNLAQNDVEQMEHKLADLEAVNKKLMAENQELVTSLNNKETELHRVSAELTVNCKLVDSLMVSKEELVEQMSAKELALNSAKNDAQQIQQIEKEKLELACHLDKLKMELDANKELIETLTTAKNGLIETLANTKTELAAEKSSLSSISERQSETEEAYNLAVGDIKQLKQQLIDLEAVNAKIAETSEKEKNILVSSLENVTTKLDRVSRELNQNRVLVETLTTAKNELTEKLLKMEQSLVNTREELTKNFDGMEEAYKATKTELQSLQQTLRDLEAANAVLKTEMDKEKQDLLSQLDEANLTIAHLEDRLVQFKETECAILRKLEEKQASDEAAVRLKAELLELKSTLEVLREKSDLAEKSGSDLAAANKKIVQLQKTIEILSAEKEAMNSSLAKNRDQVCELSSVVNELSDFRRKAALLETSNVELCAVLGEIQHVLQLPENAVRNATFDADTKSYLRMFHENVNRQRTDRDALLSEQQRLTIEVEKLTSEKVHFEIKAAELDAFGKSQEDQIHALSGKLARLEASMSKRPRRSDPIGPRRLEKLEAMNETLHDLLLGLFNAMEMPIAEKMRLVSQREVEAAAKQILDHAAKLAHSVNTLKEQMKTLDQENQELSDKMEALLKDKSRLELKMIAIQKNSDDFNKSLKTKTPSVTKLEEEVNELKIRVKELDDENEELSNTVEALLKDNSKLEMQILQLNENDTFKGKDELKTASVSKLEEEVNELKTRVKGLDDENEELSNTVEALLKDNGKLEMEILEFNENISKACNQCQNVKKEMNGLENELKSVKLNSKQYALGLKSDLKQLQEKYDNLDQNLKEKEQQLLRSLNSVTRTDDIRMGGSGGGLTKEMVQGEKIRSLTKDNTLLKELLRTRAQTIKKLEKDLNSLSKKSGDELVVTNSNSMNSPIRERKCSLRTRGDVAAAYKRALRPERSQGIENMY